MVRSAPPAAANEARAAYERLDLKRHETVVEPQIVVEIAFDIIQRSELHASGYSLRFPRIVRLRPDKRPKTPTRWNAWREIYAEMLAREGVSETVARTLPRRRSRRVSGAWCARAVLRMRSMRA